MTVPGDKSGGRYVSGVVRLDIERVSGQARVMAARRIGTAELSGGIRLEAFLDNVHGSIRWLVSKDDKPFLRCPAPSDGRIADLYWTEAMAAAFLLASALQAYLVYPD